MLKGNDSETISGATLGLKQEGRKKKRSKVVTKMNRNNDDLLTLVPRIAINDEDENNHTTGNKKGKWD